MSQGAKEMLLFFAGWAVGVGGVAPWWYLSQQNFKECISTLHRVNVQNIVDEMKTRSRDGSNREQVSP